MEIKVQKLCAERLSARWVIIKKCCSPNEIRLQQSFMWRDMLFCHSVGKHLDPVATNYRTSLHTDVGVVVGAIVVAHRYTTA